jgi:chorismate mutase
MSAYLEKRLAELNEEIRHYPGPIARCDEHLPALLEERARLMAELQLQENESCPPPARWAHDGGRVDHKE